MGVLIGLCFMCSTASVVLAGFVLSHADNLRREVRNLRADVDVLNDIADGHAKSGGTPAANREEVGRPPFWRF